MAEPRESVDIYPPNALTSLHRPPMTASAHRIGEIHLDVRLTGDQVAAFIALREALRVDNTRLACDKPVHNNADVARWLFEQVAMAVTL